MHEGGGTEKKKAKKSARKNEESLEGPVPSTLSFLKVVEKIEGRKPAGTEHLPADVLAVGSQAKDS